MSTKSAESTDKTTPYITLGYLKQTLGIDADNEVNDKKLLDVVFIANQEIDTRIKPLLGVAPIPAGTETYIQAQKTAGLYAKSVWYEHMSDLERSKHNDEKFEKKLEALLVSIRADNPERTRAVFIRARDPTSPIFQPANVDEYITREF